ncbi:MAG: hypothetical protein DYG89_23295 [Caldilinea sp. CFX5]|nr:hypothetical protein [Caldilinea sp. CFX5]
MAERREWLLFLLLVGPNFLLFAVFTYWPLIYNGYLSFVRWDMLAPIKLWVGLDNYQALFTSAAFGRMLTNTLVFTFGSVVAICALGLLMALLLNQPLRGRNAVRSIVFSPVMLSGVAIGLVWIYIFDARYGLIDWLFQGVTWQFGGKYSDPDFNMHLADEKTVAAGQFYKDTVQEYKWARPSKDIQTDFINGLTAAMMASTGSMGGVKANAQFEFGTAFLPKKGRYEVHRFCLQPRKHGLLGAEHRVHAGAQECRYQ